MTIPDRQDDKDAVGALLQATLDAVVATYAQQNELLPERQYLTVTAPVVDCEQVTVSGMQVYDGVPGGDPNQVQRCDGPRSCVMEVQLWRKDACTIGNRGVGAPTPASLTANALQLGRDAWLLLDSAGVVNAAGMSTGVIADVNFLAPQGGYVGVQMNLTITIP